MKIVMSSGHSKKVRGAAGPSPWGLDEVDCARQVVEHTAEILRSMGVECKTIHDDVSTSQNANLNWLVSQHNNSPAHDLDVSVHFNAYSVTTTKLMGCEVLYASNAGLEVAERTVDAICDAVPWPNRGPKHRGDLAFLNGTNEIAVLVETCFVDSKPDADMYRAHFNEVCQALAEGLADQEAIGEPPPIEPIEPPEFVLPPVSQRRTLKKGLEGDDVAYLQRVIGTPWDGDFGSVTHEQVKSFQAACYFASGDVDGIVGQMSWPEIDKLRDRMLAGTTGLTNEQVQAIIEMAQDSPLQEYNWPGRGPSPEGYLPGMALCFAVALLRFEAEDDAAMVMADEEGHPDTDAMAWLADEFQDLDIYTEEAGVDMMRHLFVLMIGLGLRESSGRYCEGRDMSASNVEAETAEAALFQTSWNISTADSSLPPMLDMYWNNPQGFRDVFREGVSPDASDLDCYGSGDGARYQWLAKYCPLFAVLSTAVGLRTRRQHWGPVNRKEVTLKREADTLLKKVQALMEGASA